MIRRLLLVASPVCAALRSSAKLSSMLSEHSPNVPPGQPAFPAPPGSLPPVVGGEEQLRRDIRQFGTSLLSMGPAQRQRASGILWDRANATPNLSAETLFLALTVWLPHLKILEGETAAVTLCQSCLDRLPRHSPFRLSVMTELAQLKEDAGETEIALALYKQAFSSEWRDDFRSDAKRALWIESTFLPLFITLLGSGQPIPPGDRAEYQRRAVAAVAHLPETSVWHARMTFFQADLWRSVGRADEAALLYRRSWQLLRRWGQTREPWAGELCFHLGAAAGEGSELERARRWFLRASWLERRSFGATSPRQLGGLSAAVQMCSLLNDGETLRPLRRRIDALCTEQPPSTATRWAQFVLSAAEFAIEAQPSPSLREALFRRSAEVLCASVQEEDQPASVVTTLYDLLGPAAIDPLAAAIRALGPTAEFHEQLKHSFLALSSVLRREAGTSSEWQTRQALFQAEGDAILLAATFADGAIDPCELRFDAGMAYECAGLAVEARALYETEIDQDGIDDAEHLTLDNRRRHALARTALTLGLMPEAGDTLRWLSDELPEANDRGVLALKHEISTWRAFVAVRLGERDVLEQILLERVELRRALGIHQPDPMSAERRARAIDTLTRVLRTESAARRTNGATQQWVLRRVVRFCNPEGEDLAEA